jgi:hypothetical protein
MKIQLKRMRGREHKMLTGKDKRSKCDRGEMSSQDVFPNQIGTVREGKTKSAK